MKIFFATLLLFFVTSQSVHAVERLDCNYIYSLKSRPNFAVRHMMRNLKMEMYGPNKNRRYKKTAQANLESIESNSPQTQTNIELSNSELVLEKQPQEKKQEVLSSQESNIPEKTYPISAAQGIFHRVKSGSYTTIRNYKTVTINVTDMPMVMATQLSQHVYAEIAKASNSRYPNRPFLIPDPSYHIGLDRPVENVSSNDYELWIEALNELALDNDPIVQSLFPQFKPGMRFEPYLTSDQREYLMKMALTEDQISIEKLITPTHYSRIRQYISYDRKYAGGLTFANTTTVGVNLRSDSMYGTENVVGFKPLFVDGMPFYGLVGNVTEATSDKFQVATGTIRLYMGGSFVNNALTLSNTTYNRLDNPSPLSGYRPILIDAP